jgi:hypothetical protein
MRLSRWAVVALVAALPLSACEELTGLGHDPDAPTNLTYQLIPSGDPTTPSGVLLTWEIPRSSRVAAFNVYGRLNGGNWLLRATTTSPSYHDVGAPDDQYYVASRDDGGDELSQSNTITIDRTTRLPAPQALASISLNGAIQLTWAGNAITGSNGLFDHYRVYSTDYDGTRGVCTTNWTLEGSTVSDAFLAGNLPNGTSRCFAVSAVSHDGHESAWSDLRLDTPRIDARNAFVYPSAEKSDSAGFLFLDESTKQTGVVSSVARTDLDFTLERHSDGSLWFTPARAGVTLTLYSLKPVSDLTAVDSAPSTGFGTAAIEVLPSFAYVFRLQKADGIHFAAIRVAFTTSDYAVFDWAYQNGPGNPELSRMP